MVRWLDGLWTCVMKPIASIFRWVEQAISDLPINKLSNCNMLLLGRSKMRYGRDLCFRECNNFYLQFDLVSRGPISGPRRRLSVGISGRAAFRAPPNALGYVPSHLFITHSQSDTCPDKGAADNSFKIFPGSGFGKKRDDFFTAYAVNHKTAKCYKGAYSQQNAGLI